MYVVWARLRIDQVVRLCKFVRGTFVTVDELEGITDRRHPKLSRIVALEKAQHATVLPR
jgi:hypothetical protein